MALVAVCRFAASSGRGSPFHSLGLTQHQSLCATRQNSQCVHPTFCRVPGHSLINCRRRPASRRQSWCYPSNSCGIKHVRPRRKTMRNAGRVSAWRRELNSHETARPRWAASKPSVAEPKTSRGAARSASENQDEALLWRTESVGCERPCGLQSVLRAAAANTAVHHQAVARRRQVPAWHSPSAQRRRRCLPSVRTPGSRPVLRARPNTSLNHRTHYGGLSWPGLKYTVHSLSPGQAIPPPVSG